MIIFILLQILTWMTKTKNKALKILLVISIVFGVFFVLFIGGCALIYNKYELDIQKLTSTNNGIRVYSSNGTEHTLYNTNRSVVELESLPNYVPQAFIDVEDKRFYKHNGYDLKRILKAAFVNFTTKSKSQGASTISQQLIKNALLTNKKTYGRKIKEVVLSIKMEKKFTKDEILEMYLNTIYFGSNAYGIENASKTYFNKSASELTENEACCLAGIIKSPNSYSPLNNYEKSIKRRNVVAKCMFNAGNLTKKQYNDITNSKINVTNLNNIDYSYEQQAIYEACSLLNLTERELINKRYSIITYKQDELQNQVAKASSTIISKSENFYDTDLDTLSILLDNQGRVIAHHQNSAYNLHNLKRQPASLFKPIAVYLPCFIHNILSPASVIVDEEINYSGYTPENADKIFHGPVSVRDSLINSYNIPAVKALDYLGLNKCNAMLEDLGIYLNASDFNLSLALGATTHGVKLLDLLTSYSVLANMGVNNGITFVDKILDQNNNIIYENSGYSKKIISEDDCYLINDILKDTATSGTAKRLGELDLPIASKTGTASNQHGKTDLYNIAYSTEHTILTWIGSIKNTTLPNQILSSVEPTEINKQIVKMLYKSSKPSDFKKPDNITLSAYDLSELEKSKQLVAPNHNLERYIAYDYFKNSNLPIKQDSSVSTNLNVSIQKNGAKICFEASKIYEYYIMKKTNSSIINIGKISNNNNMVEFIDNDIFRFDEIEYYITNKNSDIISESIKIRPKDYLINILNSEIISGKKKWLV